MKTNIFFLGMILFFGSLLLVTEIGNAGGNRLISKGMVVVEARVPVGAGETLLFAQKEFTNILSILSGSPKETEKAEKPLIVYLATIDQMKEAREALEKNNLSKEKLGREGFLIDKTGDNLIVTGYSEAGVLYGMYHLLEQSTGYRFVRPLNDMEPAVLVKNAVVMETPFYSAPAFQIRGFCASSSAWDRPFPDFLDWMARNRMNYRAMSVGSYPYNQKEQTRRGMISGVSGHSFADWLPPSNYFSSHPEYYGLINGKRNSGAQLCTSNPAVVEEVAKNMIAYIQNHPEVEFIPLCPDDGEGKWCQCENCLALDAPEEKAGGEGTGKPRPYTTRYIKFVNAVADKVCAVYPTKKIQIYAYSWEFVMPPVGVKPHKNVIIEFCPLYKCTVHGINSPECPRNQMFKKWLEEWASYGNPIYFRDYYVFPGRDSFPEFSLASIKEELQYFKKLGVIVGAVPEMFPDGPNGANWEPGTPYISWGVVPYRYILEWDAKKLIYYGLARLLWDPDQSVEKIVEDFCLAYYGPSVCEPMKAYFLKLDHDWYLSGEPGKYYSREKWENDSGWVFTGPSCYGWNWNATPKVLAGRILNKDNVKDYSDLLLAAAKLAKTSGNPTIIEHVDENVRLFELWCSAVDLDWRQGKDTGYGEWTGW